METSTKANGTVRTRSTGSASSGVRMAPSTRASGRITYETVWADTWTTSGASTSDSGARASEKVKGTKYRQTAGPTRVSGAMTRNMATASRLTKMALSTLVFS